MSDIIKAITNKQPVAAKKAIFEALEAKKIERLSEAKKAIAATLGEAEYGGRRHSFTKKNPVRADAKEMNKIISANTEKWIKDRADKKAAFEASKKKRDEKEIKEGRLKDAAIEYEEKYGKKPESTDDLAKLRKDKPKSLVSRFANGAANIAKADKKKLNEVSKELLGRYIKSAKQDSDKAAFRQGIVTGKNVKKDGTGLKKLNKQTSTAIDQHADHQDRRTKGIGKAVDKITGKAKVVAKEETIKEVSKALLGRYVSKATDDKKKNQDRANMAHYKDKWKTALQYDKKADKRSKGIDKASKLMAKEENIQEVSKGMAKAYLEASKRKAGGEKSPQQFRNRIQGHNLAQKKLGMKPKRLGPAKVMAKEETIKEVSKNLLARYVSRAAHQAAGNSKQAGMATIGGAKAMAADREKKSEKRLAGIRKATDKIISK